jgi:hypothetical protein
MGGRGTPGGPQSSNPKRSYNPAFGEEASRKGEPKTWTRSPERGPRRARRAPRPVNSPGDLEEGSYAGLLYLADFFGALAAVVIYRGKRWGWALGLLVAGGAFGGYAISRTVGLPGLPVETEWLEPLGVLSLLVEGLFVGLSGHRAMEEYAPKIGYLRDTPTPVTGV